jgi:hypothetical protein
MGREGIVSRRLGSRLPICAVTGLAQIQVTDMSLFGDGFHDEIVKVLDRLSD